MANIDPQVAVCAWSDDATIYYGRAIATNGYLLTAVLDLVHRQQSAGMRNFAVYGRSILAPDLAFLPKLDLSDIYRTDRGAFLDIWLPLATASGPVRKPSWHWMTCWGR